jgi:hypothetical protein
MTKKTTASKGLKTGDRVAVPWGLDEIVGTVAFVYGQSVMVRVPIEGSLGETLAESEISFRRDSLRLVPSTQ